MTKTWFIADTHFGHKNVLKYDARPWENLEDMERDIIANWNKTVGKFDTVWFLGDLCFNFNQERTRQLIGKLNGIKMMVMGNHDQKSRKFYEECGFEFVSRWPVIVKDYFILSHQPVFTTPEMANNGPYYNIYGHVHNDEHFQTQTEQTFCVCCCRHDYKPVRVEAFDKYQKTELKHNT